MKQGYRKCALCRKFRANTVYGIPLTVQERRSKRFRKTCRGCAKKIRTFLANVKEH